MKKLLTLCLVILMAFGLNAQDTPQQDYLLFEFMAVKSDKWSDYQKVEEFWSGIHKQRVADKSIIGWDLWSLTPSGVKQGSQYLTVTVFASLKDMLQAVESLDVMPYIKKAYPNKKEAELTAMFNMTGLSRDMSHQVMFKGVVDSKDNFEMKVGTLATMAIVKDLDDSYDKLSEEVFLPRHQKLIDEGKKGSWGVLKAILPVGSEAYGSHIAVSMYKDIDQLAQSLDTKNELDLLTKLAFKEVENSRQMKEVKIAKLEMMVR